MQRRAAAVSVAVLLLLSAGSYAAIGFAEEPTVSVDGPHELRAGDSFSAGGQTYTATDVGDGSATFAWTVEAATYTEAWANGSEVTHDGGSWVVDIPGEEPTQFTLRETQDVDAILAEDPDVADETVTVDGEEHVYYPGNDTVEPLSSYLPPRETVTIAAGETLQRGGNATTVSELTPAQATLTWTAPRTESTDVDTGGNVTLDRTYLAHVDGSSVVLTTDFEAYQAQVDAVDYFNERINGLWAVSILTGLTAALLVGFAYLPSRY